MTAPADRDNPDAVRRRKVRRTALTVAAIALAVYAAFILSGVLAR